MTSVPYPSFTPSCKVEDRYSMSAVGRCRITMSSSSSSFDNNNTPSSNDMVVQQQIFAKCKEQADCGSNTEQLSKDEIKKLQKKYMKQSVAMASSYLINDLHLDTSIIDIEVYLPNIHDIINTAGNIMSCLLDAGCARIVIPYHITNDGGGGKYDDDDYSEQHKIYQQIILLAGIPRERLMVHIIIMNDNDNKDILKIQNIINTESIERFQDDCNAISICVPDTCTKEDICTLLDVTTTTTATSYMDVVVQISPTHYQLQMNNNNESLDEQFATMIGTILKNNTPKDRNTTTISLIDPTPELLGLSYAACIVTDRMDKLYTTVVCTRTNEALGLVYSSITSIIAALQCGRGVYYSRSRQNLWRKGDTSGHYQTLHRIDIDCDGDAIRFTVTQNSPSITTKKEDDTVENTNENKSTAQHKAPAAFCHLETLTCWGTTRGIRHLEETLQDRLHNAIEGSYTQRLFHDTTLLRDKLVEEAQELAEADTPQHVAEELADVLYFSLVRAAQYGITLEDAVIELDRRSRKVTRRQGDSKTYRIDAANAILDKK